MDKRFIAVEDILKLKFLSSPQLNPEGRLVAFTVKTVDQDKNRYLYHLWIEEVESGQVRQFTLGRVTDTTPRWSPDEQAGNSSWPSSGSSARSCSFDTQRRRATASPAPARPTCASTCFSASATG